MSRPSRVSLSDALVLQVYGIEAPVKIATRIVRHGRYVVFLLAEVAVPRALFAEILRRVDRLRPKPRPA
jgi:hypothetical protein